MSEAGTGRGGGRPQVHAATSVLRELVQATAELDHALGRHLQVNATDLRVMSRLLQHGPQGQGALASALGIAPSATSMAVERLERQGHLTRDRDPEDRRRVVVRPSPGSAERARAALLPMILETDRVVGQLTEGERETVTAYLRAVTDAVRRAAVKVGEQVGGHDAEG